MVEAFIPTLRVTRMPPVPVVMAAVWFTGGRTMEAEGGRGPGSRAGGDVIVNRCANPVRGVGPAGEAGDGGGTAVGDGPGGAVEGGVTA